MTTRAGLVGLGAGVLSSLLLFYPLYMLLPGFHLERWPDGAAWPGVFLAVMAGGLLVASGGWAAAWGGADRPGQRVALGALAGGLAGVILFCSLGAAAGGVLAWGLGQLPAGHDAPAAQRVAETLIGVIDWTHRLFWGMALSGIALGSVGGAWIAPMLHAPATRPGTISPQMALNTTLTAAPSAAFAVVLAAGMFSGWLRSLQANLALTHTVLTRSPQMVLTWPLTTALLLYLAAQLALTLVTHHEAQQASHRCGLDEVKMAAYIGMASPLALAAMLGVIHGPLLFRPIVLISLLIAAGMSARLLVVLVRLILPRRAQMPPPPDEWQAIFFGSIAGSHGQSLTLLCLGCGLMMVAPTYVVTAAAVINIASILSWPDSGGVPGWTAAISPELVQHLYLTQAAAGLGSTLVITLVLTLVYLFYLGLGKAFRRMRLGQQSRFLARHRR